MAEYTTKKSKLKVKITPKDNQDDIKDLSAEELKKLILKE